MSPAELRTFRESLGLSIPWMANNFNVPLERVTGWEIGRCPLPEGVTEALVRIDLLIETTVESRVAALLAARDRGELPGAAVLLRFWNDEDLWRFYPELQPLSSAAYGTLLTRLSRELRARGIESCMEYLDATRYLAWLGDKPDNEPNRVKWAIKAMERRKKFLAKLRNSPIKKLSLTVGGLPVTRDELSSASTS
ncbi:MULTISPECIES: helix-turn-helix domain-containing protein [Ralstonia]|jgi:hypothetical protein|uniref:Uncharacterized protein n=2 Tax=Ralstonia pickettii TaxID=329 RepID=R0DX26_RALPI|nr:MULTISPECIES: hypothetical protein [Ralstonia]ENZ77983.1 hypothetical protein OR214_02259 [Ralstonia pickettii OR214]MCM3581926.1 hypothetical protein [Ralstonia pickettii]